MLSDHASLPNGPGVTIAPLDAFLLRTDLDPITFEALGNDQNYREVTKDQHGVPSFRFRYSLRAHAGSYNGAQAFAWSRCVASPLMAMPGRLVGGASVPRAAGAIEVDPARAIATCLKPTDGPALGGVILRLWETLGQSTPLAIGVRGYRRAIRTDLLERDLEELRIADGKVSVPLRAHGVAAIRLLP